MNELDLAKSAHRRVASYLENRRLRAGEPSAYWKEESESLEYIFDASESVLRRLRDHTHWLTGIRSYEYKNHHNHRHSLFQAKYNALKAFSDGLELHGEMNVLGDFGHKIDGKLINLDTLKFIESCIALNRHGVLEEMAKFKKPVICEVGAGWGGFISHLARYLPGAQFVVVDLPATMLFSATYLATAFPSRSIGFFGSPEYSGKEDFIFVLPHDFINEFSGRIDLAVNMVSFQEMTDKQVQEYSEKFKKLGTKYLYSHNRTRSNHNNEIQDVEKSIGKWDEKVEIKILPVDYTFLEIPEKNLEANVFQKVFGRLIKSSTYMAKIVNRAFSEQFKLILFGNSRIIEKRNYRHIIFSTRND